MKKSLTSLAKRLYYIHQLEEIIMSAFNVTYINTINQRQAVITMLGYSERMVEKEFNTYGGNLTVIGVQKQ